MNKCIFVGRLTRDPEVSFSEKAQMSVARFTVAVDRIPKREGEPEADFFNCVAFDRKAEFVEQYWYSGMRVAVSGKLQNENYTNKKGEKVYGVSLKADDVEFADGKKDADNGQPQTQSAAPPKAAASANTAAAQTSGTTAPASRAAAPASRTTAPASRAAAPASRTAAPASNQGAAKPAAGRSTPQRQAPGRSATGRSASQRGAARTAASDGFMNVASGMEEGLPFN